MGSWRNISLSELKKSREFPRSIFMELRLNGEGRAHILNCASAEPIVLCNPDPVFRNRFADLCGDFFGFRFIESIFVPVFCSKMPMGRI